MSWTKSYPLLHQTWLTTPTVFALFPSYTFEVKLISDNNPAHIKSYKLRQSLGEYPDYKQSETFFEVFLFSFWTLFNSKWFMVSHKKISFKRYITSGLWVYSYFFFLQKKGFFPTGVEDTKISCLSWTERAFRIFLNGIPISGTASCVSKPQ